MGQVFSSCDEYNEYDLYRGGIVWGNCSFVMMNVVKGYSSNSSRNSSGSSFLFICYDPFENI